MQYVVRPDLNFRGYAGQVASGIVKPGDPVMVLPSGRTSRVKSIVAYEGELSCAFPPMSVTLCLEDEIDISRGDMLVPPSHPPHVVRRLDARLVWMHEQKLEIGHGYLLKHATQTVRATVDTVRYRVNINTLEKEPGAELGLNDIGAVVIQTQKPIFCDPYRRNRTIGSFILIDPMTNATVGAGMITGREPGTRQPPLDPGALSVPKAGCARRAASARRPPRCNAVAEYFRTRRFSTRAASLRLRLPRPRHPASPSAPEICRALNEAGVIALVYDSGEPGIARIACVRIWAGTISHLRELLDRREILSFLKEKEIT